MLAVGAAVAAPLILSNEQIRLSIDPDRGRIAEFAEQSSGQNFADSAAQAALWDATLIKEDGQLLHLNSGAAKKISVSAAGSGAIKLRWSNFEQPQLQVEALVQLDRSSALSRWTIAFTNLSNLRLRQVRFPILPNIPEQPGEVLAVPAWMGQLASKPRQTLFAKTNQVREWDYPGHTSMQCISLYGEKAGFYLSCDDTNAFRKSFAFWTDAERRLNAGVVHLPESSRGPGYALLYSVVLGTFRGDWFTAAERYRTWATNQWWVAESRVETGAVPDWARETGLWIWNRGRSEQVLEPAAVLQKQLGLPVSVFWHWWHGCAYDVGFPEYLPPREGELAFSEAMTKARAQGIHAIVYMNQRLWGMTTESWKTKSAEKFAVKGTDRKVRPEIYNTFTKSPCASMCMGTEFWRNTYAGLAEEAIRKLGVDGIYMDQACSSLACYDPLHGHPVGGGTYWMNGFRLLSSDIRSRCAPALLTLQRDPIALAGEGVGESWLPYLDLMLSLQVSRERYAGPDGWEPIPFFQAVYHPYALQYGNYASLTMPPYDELWPREFAPEQPLKLLDRIFSSQFYLEQARAFVWGQQPTLANFLPSHLDERRQEIEFVLQLARLRSQALKFLRDGVLVELPPFAGDQRIDMSRLSIYAGQQGGLKTFEKRVPQALAAVWRAPDTNLGLAMVNLTDNPVEVKLPESVTLDFRPKRIEIIREHSRKVLNASWADAGLHLQPREAVVVEFLAN